MIIKVRDKNTSKDNKDIHTTIQPSYVAFIFKYAIVVVVWFMFMLVHISLSYANEHSPMLPSSAWVDLEHKEGNKERLLEQSASAVMASSLAMSLTMPLTQVHKILRGFHSLPKFLRSEVIYSLAVVGGVLWFAKKTERGSMFATSVGSNLDLSQVHTETENSDYDLKTYQHSVPSHHPLPPPNTPPQWKVMFVAENHPHEDQELLDHIFQWDSLFWDGESSLSELLGRSELLKHRSHVADLYQKSLDDLDADQRRLKETIQDHFGGNDLYATLLWLYNIRYFRYSSYSYPPVDDKIVGDLSYFFSLNQETIRTASEELYQILQESFDSLNPYYILDLLFLNVQDSWYEPAESDDVIVGYPAKNSDDHQ
ncbi:MAG: hypothetical protein OXC44_03570 [Proteobacteria bacterium]|nr:hypothetical protein [Pseudomonadota bacterium]